MTPNNFSIFRYYAKDLTRMNKKRFLALAVSVVVGGSIAASCTATPDEVEGTAIAETTVPAVAPVADTYTAPTHTPPTATADEDRFILLLESQDFNYGGDEDLAVETGLATCGALDRGAGVSQVISVIIGEGYSGYDAGTFLGATVYALCTEHVSTVEAFLESVN